MSMQHLSIFKGVFHSRKKKGGGEIVLEAKKIIFHIYISDHMFNISILFEFCSQVCAPNNNVHSSILKVVFHQKQ